MENVVTEYGNALIALVSGGALLLWGLWKYAAHSLWLRESKKTDARVVAIDQVLFETESSVDEYDQPTFKYNTTGKVLIAKARQYFPKGTLKVGDPYTVRYNHRTPGRIHTESGEDFGLMTTFVTLFAGGVLILIASILFFS
jgi:hypothetical protein